MLSSRWDETAPSRQRAGCGVAGGWITGEADGSRLEAAQPLGAAVHAVPRGPAEPAGPEPDHRAQPGHGEQRRRRADRRGPGRRGGSGRLRRWPAAHPAAGEPRPSVRGRGRCRRDAHPDRGLRPDDAPAGDGGQPARLRPARSGRRGAADPGHAERGPAAGVGEPRAGAGRRDRRVRHRRAGSRGDGVRADHRLGGGRPGADAAHRHRAADLRGQRGEDAGPGRDVVRRRARGPARGDRAGRLRRRRCRHHQRHGLPGGHQQRRRVGAYQPGLQRPAVPVWISRLPGGVRRRGGRPRSVPAGARRQARPG